jgi:Ca-activated chloride channel family protein
MIEQLHIMRPLWLWLVPVIVVAWWLVRRRERDGGSLGELIAPHLRDALTVNRNGQRGIKAVDGVALGMLLLAVAASGPAWDRQAAPWFTETAPLVIALEVSDSMRSNDLMPTRLDRARFKILDLIAARTGSRTALVAYAGSAHVVMPPSSDADVLKPFLESLDPAIMPARGADVAKVLPLARQLLGDATAPGTLLFVNDGFAPADVTALAAFAAEPGAPALVSFVVGTDAGGVALMPDGSPVMSGGARLDTRVDAATLQRVSREAGISVVRTEPGDADIRALMRQIESRLQQADDPDAEWRDQAWWLLWPVALLLLAWFRRGWTMSW